MVLRVSYRQVCDPGGGLQVAGCIWATTSGCMQAKGGAPAFRQEDP